VDQVVPSPLESSQRLLRPRCCRAAEAPAVGVGEAVLAVLEEAVGLERRMGAHSAGVERAARAASVSSEVQASAPLAVRSLVMASLVVASPPVLSLAVASRRGTI